MSKKAEGFSLRFVLINTGNISRKVLSKVLRSFDKNFERLHQEKEEYEPYVPGKSVENPTMEDFKGEWICTLMDAFGMQMPVNSELTGFEMMLSIQEDKSELIVIESGEEGRAELQGEMDGNILVLKTAAGDEAGTMLFSCDTMRLSLLDDGKLCFEPESDGSEEETSETDGEDFSVNTYFDKIDVVE